MELVFRLKEKYLRIEKYVMPVALLTGFLWDNFTLRRVDLWVENIAFLFYLALALLVMSFLYAYDSGKFRTSYGLAAREVAPFFLQFIFGGLFSAFLVFYSRSSSVFVSWPFLVGFLWLLVGNEFFREKYSRTVFNFSVFFAALFSYVIFALPVLWGSMGALTFVVGGIFSLIFISFIGYLFYFISSARIRVDKKALTWSIGAIYVLFNFFYFTNLIPPIPLSLIEGGVYHSVSRVGQESYQVSYEPAHKYIFWREESSTYHFVKGEAVYVFSSVFAPTRLNTTIYHRWSILDELTGKWVTKDHLSFSIFGGRDGGYRGFTKKTNIIPGKWRVDVENGRGQVLGRITFKTVQVLKLPTLLEFNSI